MPAPTHAALDVNGVASSTAEYRGRSSQRKTDRLAEQSMFWVQSQPGDLRCHVHTSEGGTVELEVGHAAEDGSEPGILCIAANPMLNGVDDMECRVCTGNGCAYDYVTIQNAAGIPKAQNKIQYRPF